MAVNPSAITLRSSDPGPLLRETPLERRTTMVAAAAGLVAAGLSMLSPSTRGLDQVVRVAVALPAFALGFGVVMVSMAAASDLRVSRQRSSSRTL
jgi:hypothetical protein